MRLYISTLLLKRSLDYLSTLKLESRTSRRLFWRIVFSIIIWPPTSSFGAIKCLCKFYITNNRYLTCRWFFQLIYMSVYRKRLLLQLAWSFFYQQTLKFLFFTFVEFISHLMSSVFFSIFFFQVEKFLI